MTRSPATKSKPSATAGGWPIATATSKPAFCPRDMKQPASSSLPFRHACLPQPAGRPPRRLHVPPERHDQPGVSYYTPAYEADPGITWQLDSAATKLAPQQQRLLRLQTGRPYNPADHFSPTPTSRSRLPMAPNTCSASPAASSSKFSPPAKSCVFTDNAIVSTSGERIQFIRDASGRLSSLLGPDGTQLPTPTTLKGT